MNNDENMSIAQQHYDNMEKPNNEIDTEYRHLEAIETVTDDLETVIHHMQQDYRRDFSPTLLLQEAYLKLLAARKYLEL